MSTRVNQLGMALAHALASREASKIAHNRNAYQYWRNRVQYLRGRLNTALRDQGFEVPVPEQRPLLLDDLVDKIKPHRK